MRILFTIILIIIQVIYSHQHTHTQTKLRHKLFQTHKSSNQSVNESTTVIVPKIQTNITNTIAQPKIQRNSSNQNERKTGTVINVESESKIMSANKTEQQNGSKIVIVKDEKTGNFTEIYIRQDGQNKTKSQDQNKTLSSNKNVSTITNQTKIDNKTLRVNLTKKEDPPQTKNIQQNQTSVNLSQQAIEQAKNSFPASPSPATSTKIISSLPSIFLTIKTPLQQFPQSRGVFSVKLSAEATVCHEKCRVLGGISCKIWSDDAITCCQFVGCQMPFYCSRDKKIYVEGCNNRD